MLRKTCAIVVSALALAVGTAEGSSVNLVQNGDFDAAGTLANWQNGWPVGGPTGTRYWLPGWTRPDSMQYNFIFGPGGADTTGATGSNGNVTLWGPGNGPGSSNYSDNHMPATSPNGGNYFASDPAYGGGPLQQTISGLTIGQAYAVSFYWAGAQQSLANKTPLATNEWWQVTLGAKGQTPQSFSTSQATLDAKGFAPWTQETFIFTATSASEILSFISHSDAVSGSGQPPFLLLDGVTMSAVPEPTSVLLLGGGVVGLGVVGLRRRRSAAASV